MANPLAILGQLAGGLSQIGSEGAAGALGGDIEGQILRRKFASEDVQNQLRALEAIAKMNQMQRPLAVPPGGTLVDPRTGQPMFTGPERPMSVAPGGTLVNPQTGQPVFQAPPRPERPVSVPEGGTLVNPLTGEPMFKGQPKAPTTELGRFMQKANPQNIAEYLEALRKFSEAQHPTAGTSVPTVVGPMAGPPGHEKEPWMYEKRVTRKPEGGLETQYIPIKPAAERPSASSQPRETTTTGYTIVPRKEIKDDNSLRALTSSLPNLVTELGQERGIDLAAEYKKRPNPLMLRFIEREARKRFGTELSVGWDGSKFKINRAWEPAQRRVTGGTRTVGPPGQVPAPGSFPVEGEEGDTEEGQ